MKEFFIAIIYIAPFIIAGLIHGFFGDYFNLFVINQFCEGSFQNCIFEVAEDSHTNKKIPLYIGIMTIILFSLTFGTAKLKSNNISEQIIKFFIVSALYIVSIISSLVTYFYLLNGTNIFSWELRKLLCLIKMKKGSDRPYHLPNKL